MRASCASRRSSTSRTSCSVHHCAPCLGSTGATFRDRRPRFRCVRRTRAASRAGGGTSWRAGDVVLKPIDLPSEELAWLDVLASSQCFPVRCGSHCPYGAGTDCSSRMPGRRRPPSQDTCRPATGRSSPTSHGVSRPRSLTNLGRPFSTGARTPGQTRTDSPGARVGELVGVDDPGRWLRALPGDVPAGGSAIRLSSSTEPEEYS